MRKKVIFLLLLFKGITNPLGAVLLFISFPLLSLSSSAQNLKEDIHTIYALERQINVEEDVRKSAFFAEKYLEAVDGFIQKYPSEKDMGAKFLFHASEICVGLKKPVDAISRMRQLIQRFPKSKEAERCHFFIPFTFDEHLNQKDSAYIYYNEYLLKYPDGAFAEQVKYLRTNAKQDDLELIKSFENKKN